MRFRDWLDQLKWKAVRLTQRPIAVEGFELLAVELDEAARTEFADSLRAAVALLHSAGGDYAEQAARWVPNVIVLPRGEDRPHSTAPACRGLLVEASRADRTDPRLFACNLVWAAEMNAGYHRGRGTKAESRGIRQLAYKRVTHFAKTYPDWPDWLKFLQSYAPVTPENHAFQIVYDLLGKIGALPAEAIRPEHRLIEDLKIDGDDYSFWFVKEVSKRLSISQSPEAWHDISTVQDVLRVVRDHASKEDLKSRVHEAGS